MALCRAPNRTTALLINTGNTRLRFNIALMRHRAFKFSLYDNICCCKTFLNIAALESSLIGYVTRMFRLLGQLRIIVFVHQSRVGRHRFKHVQHWRQRFILHLDRSQRGFREHRRRCRHRGYRMSVIQDFVSSHNIFSNVVQRAAAFATNLAFDATARKICATDRRKYTRQSKRAADINAEEFCMRVRTAQNLAMDHIRQYGVRTELRTPSNLIEAIRTHWAAAYLLIIYCFCHDSILVPLALKCSTQAYR